VSRAHRFRVVPALGVSAAKDDARRVLKDGLGLPLVDEDDASLAFGMGRLAVYVDATGTAPVVSGFLPMLAIDDLAWAIAHLRALGCTTGPMPWAPDNPGVLVRGPGGLAFCVVPEDHVYDARAMRAVDETSSVDKKIPRAISGIFTRTEGGAAPSDDGAASPDDGEGPPR